jgi:hypothetical protein
LWFSCINVRDFDDARNRVGHASELCKYRLRDKTLSKRCSSLLREQKSCDGYSGDALSDEGAAVDHVIECQMVAWAMVTIPDVVDEKPLWTTGVISSTVKSYIFRAVNDQSNLVVTATTINNNKGTQVMEFLCRYGMRRSERLRPPSLQDVMKSMRGGSAHPLLKPILEHLQVSGAILVTKLKSSELGRDINSKEEKDYLAAVADRLETMLKAMLHYEVKT